jgi:RNA polymerase sigma factor (sigma-70 family)
VCTMCSRGQSSAHPPQTVSTKPLSIDPSTPDLEAFLCAWGPEIDHAARVQAVALGLSLDEAEDFAQSARLHLLRIPPSNRSSVRYVRVVIRNAMRSAARRLSHRLGLLSSRRVELDSVDPINPESVASLESEGILSRVRQWRADLPARERDLVVLLYDEGLSQREAAALLDVSQPRVAQLHRRILERGRRALVSLTAA